MSQMKFKVAEARPIPSKTLTFKAKDNIFAVRCNGGRLHVESLVLFTRAANGDVKVIWKDPQVVVFSVGSTKEWPARRAHGERSRTSAGFLGNEHQKNIPLKPHSVAPRS
jgi:hypothetical protein